MRTHIMSNQIFSDRQLPHQFRPSSAKNYGQRAIPYNPQQQQSQAYQQNYEGEEQDMNSSRLFKTNPKIAYSNRSGSANRSVPKKPIVNNFNLNNNNNNSFNNAIDTGYTEYNKHLPKQIFQDKEKLYQETLQLKGKINEISQENIKLKTRLTTLEKETVKMERMIEEIELNGTYKNHFSKNPNDQTYLIANLKKSLKENKVELEFKQEEITKLKKSVKFTRIQELEAEKKAFSDETIRLKHLLDQAVHMRMNLNIPDGEIRSVEEKYYSQNNLITQLRKENAELAQAIKNLEDQNYHLQQSYQDIEKKNQREVLNLKKILKDKEKDLREQRGDIDKFSASPNTKSFSKNITMKREENNKMNQENKLLRDQINLKQRTISELEKKISDTQQQYREFLDKEKDENNVLKGELEKELKLNQNLRDRLRASEKSNKNESYLLADNPVDFVPKKFQERILPSNLKANKNGEKDQQKEKKETRKRVEIVTLETIKETGEELNYRFRSLGLDWEEIISIAFPNIEDDSDIPTLKKILQDEPFNIKDDEMAEYISRYCIENNTFGNWMFLDLTKKCNNQIIKSILRQIVGPYRLISKEEAQEIFTHINEVMAIKKAPLKGFMKEKAQRRAYLKKEEIIDVFTMCEVDLNKDHIDYIITCIISSSEDLQKLNYEKMFTIFEEGKQLPDFCIYNKENMNALNKGKNKTGLIEKGEQGEESDDDFQDLSDAEREAMRKHDELVANQAKSDSKEEEQHKSEQIVNSNQFNSHHQMDAHSQDHQHNHHNDLSGEKQKQQSQTSKKLEQVSKYNDELKNHEQNNQQITNNIGEKDEKQKDSKTHFQSNHSSKQSKGTNEGHDPLLESKGQQDEVINYYQDEEEEEYDEFNQHNEINQEDVSDAHIEI